MERVDVLNQISTPSIPRQARRKFYRNARWEGRGGRRHAIPVFVASEAYVGKRAFGQRRLPIVGDDIKRQVGSRPCIHRTLSRHMFSKQPRSPSSGPISSTAEGIPSSWNMLRS